MKLLVGLGNTGDKYTNTRHNIGFMIIDELIGQFDAKEDTKKRLFATVTETTYKEERLIFIKPTTMMNDSGRAVAATQQFYKISNKDTWVISDDVDLPFGELRLRNGGGSGGHQGLASIISVVGEDFHRLRIGIGDNREHNLPSEAYVLAPFNDDESAKLAELRRNAANILLDKMFE